MPLPSPASGFTYEFDSTTGTFVRSTRSFGPILSDRAETIGRGRLAFGFSSQFFSFDHLDGVSLSAVPAVFRHDSFELGGGRADVVSTTNTVEATVSQLSGALTFGSHQPDRSVAGCSHGQDQAVAVVERQDSAPRDGLESSGALLQGSRRHSADSDPPISTSRKARQAAWAISSCARKRC